jgi:hypothetical protein
MADWKIDSSVDRMTGEPKVTISTIGDVLEGPARRDFPLLAIACSGDGPGIVLSFQSIVGSHKTSEITYKFDTGKPEKANWLMTSFKDAYLVDKKQVQKFIASAKSAKSILIRISDTTVGNTDVVFQVGNSDALQKIPCK